VGQRVRAVTGARDLKPLFDVHTRRRTWPLRIGRVAVGEVALDEVTIPAPGERSPVRLQRVEVEVDARHIDKLRPFVEQLRAVCRLQPAAVSKFEGGLRAHQLAPSAQPGMGAAVIPNRKALQKATVGELAFAVLRRRFSEVLAREPGARLSLDSEAVHEMRVASRRLRSDLRLFEAVLPGEARRLREELRWVASVLGEVRDLDVEIEQVRAWLTHATSAERDALAVLEQLLSRQHQQAHSRMCQALDSPQHERFVTSFTNFLARGPSKSQASQQLATGAMPGLIARQWRKARKLGDRLGPDSPPPEYHALRIQCKRLRYAIECVTELYGQPAGRMLQRLANLQDLLGMYQDTQVAMARLRKLALRYQDELSAETLFALGALAERYARQGQDLIAEFPDCYRRLTGTAWQRFKRAMRAQRR